MSIKKVWHRYHDGEKIRIEQEPDGRVFSYLFDPILLCWIHKKELKGLPADLDIVDHFVKKEEDQNIKENQWRKKKPKK